MRVVALDVGDARLKTHTACVDCSRKHPVAERAQLAPLRVVIMKNEKVEAGTLGREYGESRSGEKNSASASARWLCREREREGSQ